MRWTRRTEHAPRHLAGRPARRLQRTRRRRDDALASIVTSDEAWQLPGTEGGISPFWSPDSASIGFFADRKLKRLDLNGLGHARATRPGRGPGDVV